ncbi:MAG TPA: TonB family protein [Bryobacterales bacterium]|nr:TonB family protein [Bryobacterales bacterium]
MTTHFDPLGASESLRRPFLGSLAMHAGIFAFSVAYSWMLARGHVQFGNPNAVPGGAISIDMVKTIPMTPAQTVVENPVANDTRSSVPAPPPEKAKATEKVEEEATAIPLPGREKKQAKERRAPEKKFRPYVPSRDNQLYASKGMGVNTPSFGAPQQESFGVGIGVGSGSPFGAYYGWYADALQRRIATQWQQELTQLDQRIHTAPRTVVSFEIQRDGSLRNIRLLQSSGNSAVDYAALRAVHDSDPVPALPSGLAKSYVSTEVWFQLRR